MIKYRLRLMCNGSVNKKADLQYWGQPHFYLYDFAL